MVTKIVFFSYQPLSQKFLEIFSMKTLVENDFLVEYIDLSKIYAYRSNQSINDPQILIHKPAKISDVEEIIKSVDIKSTLFVSIVTFNGKLIKLFRLFTKYDCKLAVFTRGLFPTPVLTPQNLFKKITQSSISKLATYLGNLYAFFLKKCRIIKPYDYVFNCGLSISAIGVGHNIDSQTAQIIKVNSDDYEIFNEVKKEKPLFNFPYAVFIDEYLPFHPDVNLCGLKSIPHEEYYAKLNSFFQQVEKEMRTNIIIAAHPKAEKYKIVNYFEDRKVIFNKTAELIYYSQFVMLHHSTSIGFAILAEKPILLLPSLIEKKYWPGLYDLTNYWAEYLNIKAVHFDSEERFTKIELNYDKHKYKEYKYNYLTHYDTESNKSVDIFIEFLLNTD